MVLPLLSGPATSGRRCTTDQTLEGDPAARASTSDELRAGRHFLPETPAAGAAALGVRQPQALRYKNAPGGHGTGQEKPRGAGRGVRRRIASTAALFQDQLRERVDVGLQ